MDNSTKSPEKPEKTEKVSPTSTVKQQLTVDEPASAGGFSRDASPNARQNDEPNKVCIDLYDCYW